LKYFQTRFLDEADKFIAHLDPKAARKVFYNIDLAEQGNDPKLFKKLQKDIWDLGQVWRSTNQVTCILGQRQ
jgi:phage-related protein